MAEKTLEITECDEAGNVTATYIQTKLPQDGMGRVDMIVRSPTSSYCEQSTDIRHSYLRTPNHPGTEDWMCSCPLAIHTL